MWLCSVILTSCSVILTSCSVIWHLAVAYSLYDTARCHMKLHDAAGCHRHFTFSAGMAQNQLFCIFPGIFMLRFWSFAPDSYHLCCDRCRHGFRGRVLRNHLQRVTTYIKSLLFDYTRSGWNSLNSLVVSLIMMTPFSCSRESLTYRLKSVLSRSCRTQVCDNSG